MPKPWLVVWIPRDKQRATIPYLLDNIFAPNNFFNDLRVEYYAISLWQQQLRASVSVGSLPSQSVIAAKDNRNRLALWFLNYRTCSSPIKLPSRWSLSVSRPIVAVIFNRTVWPYCLIAGPLIWSNREEETVTLVDEEDRVESLVSSFIIVRCDNTWQNNAYGTVPTLKSR